MTEEKLTSSDIQICTHLSARLGRSLMRLALAKHSVGIAKQHVLGWDAGTSQDMIFCLPE